MTTAQRGVLALRVLMEAGIVVALGWWGFHTGGSTASRIVLALGVPAVGFGFWGLVDFRRAGRAAEPMRLVQELAVSGLAAVAWYASGRHVLGWALGGVSIVYHALVYATGARLLEHRPGSGMPGAHADRPASTERGRVSRRLARRHQ